LDHIAVKADSRHHEMVERAARRRDGEGDAVYYLNTCVGDKRFVNGDSPSLYLAVL
jgi:hypothetical protein